MCVGYFYHLVPGKKIVDSAIFFKEGSGKMPNAKWQMANGKRHRSLELFQSTPHDHGLDLSLFFNSYDINDNHLHGRLVILTHLFFFKSL